METGVVITHEPVFTKTSVEEAHAGVVLDHSTMDVDKVNLSLVLDNSTIQGQPDVAEVLNGSGETEESKDEKEEVMKTVSVVEDSEIVKEKASETETDEQGTDDGKTILTDVTLEKEKEDETTQKPEEVSEKLVTEEGQTETKHSQEEEKDISKVSEEIPIKTDEVKEEKDSTTVETSVNGTEAEHNETVSVEEISNIGKETAPEQETTTHDVETRERKDPGIVNNEETTVQESISSKEDAETVEAIKNSDGAEKVSREVVTGDKEKEEDIIHKKEEVLESPTVIETTPTIHGEDIELKASNDTEEHEETTVHEAISLKDNSNPVEAIKYSDDAEQISHEVTGDREKEGDIIYKAQEVQESLTVVETPTIQSEDIELKASKDTTEEHEHVLVRDIPQEETLAPKDETVNTSTVHESAILKTLETKSDETDAEPSLDLKEDQETVTSSDEVQETVKVVIEPPKPSPDQRSKDTEEEDEHVLGSNMPQGEIFVTQAESLVTKEDRDQEDKEEEKRDKFEVPIELALKEELRGEKKEADQVAGGQSMERAEETSVIKHPDEESGEKMKKPCLESLSKLSEETRETLDEQIQEKTEEEEEVAPHREGQEEGFYGSGTKEETVPVPESIELKEEAKEERILDLAPLQEESCLPNEQDEEDKSDEVIQVSSASPEGEALVEAKNNEEIKANEEEEQVADKLQSILEIVDAEPVKSNEETSLKDDSDTVEAIKNSDEVTGEREKEEDIIHKAQEVQESLTVVETPKIQDEDIESKASKYTEEHEHVLVRDIPQEETLVPKAETVNTSTLQESAEPSLDLKEDDETDAEPILDLKEQEETVKKTVTPSEEVKESITLMEPPKLSPEQISKDNEEDEHVLGSSMLQGDTIITEAESMVTKENKEQIMDLKEQEKTENFEEVPSDHALKVDNEELMDEKIKADQVVGAQTMERGVELNESEAELVDKNITDETEEKLVEMLVEKPSLESPSEETSKTLDEKIQEKLEEEVPEKEETVSVPESSEVDERAQEEMILHLTPLQEESCLPTEQDEEEVKEKIHKHEQENEEVKSDEVTQVSSALPEGEAVFEAKKKEEMKANLEEQVVAYKIQTSLETVETEIIKTENTESESESSKSTMEHVNLLVRDVAQIDTLVTEAEDVNNSTVQKFESNEEEVGQETRKDTEPSFDLKEDKEKEQTETVISSDEVRPSDQVGDVLTEESIDFKSKETLQVGSTEEKQEINLLDVPSGDSEKRQPETESQAKTEDIPSELVLKEELKDDKTEVDGTQVMGKQRDREPNEPEAEQIDQTKADEKLLAESVEKIQTSSPSEVSEAKSTTVGEKMEEKLQEEEEVTLQQEGSSAYGLEIKEERLSVQEIKDHGKEVSCLQQEPTEKYEPTNEVPNDQQSPVEEKSDKDIQVGGVTVNAVKLEDIKENEEEQVREEIQRSLEPMEPEEQEQETVSETTEDEKVKKEESFDQILSEEDAVKGHVTEDDIETLTAEANKGDEESRVRAMPQGETNVNENETVDTSTVQEAAVSNTLETNINESEEVHSLIGAQEEERQVTKEDTEPVISSDEGIKDESQGREESAKIKYKERDAKLLDEPAEKMPLESPSELSEETSETVDEKIEEEEEVTLHQESEETVPVPESSELGVQAKEEEEEESCPPYEQKNEMKEQKSEEDSTAAHQTTVVDQGSEEREVEKNEDLKENEKEACRPDGTGSSKQVEEEKLKQNKEILQVDESKAEEVPSSETTPQETLSDDVMAVQLKREDNATTESHEGEATFPQTRDIGTSLTDKFSIDKIQPEEQANVEIPRNEQEKVISAEEGATQTRELEEENMVDSPEKNDNETLIAEETKKGDEEKTVGLEDASKKSESERTKQEEFENLEAPKVEEKSQEVSETPAFITELEDQIPKQIEKIHEEEIKDAQVVVDQTSSLVSEQVAEILEQEEEEEETKEPHKVESLTGQDLSVEASHAHQTPSSEIDDKTGKQVEEIHKEEETKTNKLQQEEEILPTESVSSESFSETQEERHVSAVAGETKTKGSDDQIETSTKVTKVEDEEDTKETDTQVAELMRGQSLSHAPENAGLEQEELKDFGTLQPGAVMEDQDSVTDVLTFSKPIGDENSSTLPVVGILKELQATLEEKERGSNVSHEGYSSGNDLNSINAEPETLEKSLVVGETTASEIIEANLFQDSISREPEVVNDVEEQLQEETREIAECKEETPADLSLTEVLPGLIPAKQEEEGHPRYFELSKKEHNAEGQETVKEEDQTFDIEEEKKNEVLQDEKLSTLSSTSETNETFSPEVNNNSDLEDASELGVGHDSANSPQVEKDQAAHSALGNDQEMNKITEPVSVAEKDLTEEHVKSQAVSVGTKSSSGMDFTTEQIPKDQREEAEETADANLITSEKLQRHDQSKDFGQEKQSTDLKYVQEDLDHEIKDDGHDSVLVHKKDSDLIERKKEVDYVKTEPEDAIKHGVSTEEKNMCEKIRQEATKEIYQEECKQTDTATAIKEEIKEEEKETTEDNLNSRKNTDDGIKDYGLDSVVAQKKESGSIEEKKEADYVKTEVEDVIKHGLPTEVKNNMSGKNGQGAIKEIYQEECKQTNTVTAIKEEIKEEKKATPADFLNSMKNADNATEKTKPEIQEIDKLSPVSETQDKPPKQGDEVPTRPKREMADDVPKLENLKIAEEVQLLDGADETEPIGKEPARKSLSDLIQNVKVTDKTEVATTEPRIEEEAKEEGEDEDGDEHKDDKTSPDSIVMVEAKDTVSIIKTQKKSHGILSGVGSKVKHSISKVKKALTGKSSHTTKPSSPQ